MERPLRAVPIEITREKKHDIKIRWKDGSESIYLARFLRLHCACAGCVEEMTGRRLVEEGRIPQDVHPVSIGRVGRYAIAIRWSDGHDTGIYTYDYLRKLDSNV